MLECRDPPIISPCSPSWAFLSPVFLIRSPIRLIKGGKKKQTLCMGWGEVKIDDRTLSCFTFAPGKYSGLEF